MGSASTQLALEFAHRFGSDYDLIWWIPAEQPATAAAGLAGWRAGWAFRPTRTRRDHQHLFDELRQRDRWLLIYDNAEQPDVARRPSALGRGRARLGHLALAVVEHHCRADATRSPGHGESSATSRAHRVRRGRPTRGAGPPGRGSSAALAEAAAYLEQTDSG